MKRLLLIGLVLAGAWFAWTEQDRHAAPFSPAEQGASPSHGTFVAPASSTGRITTRTAGTSTAG